MMASKIMWHLQNTEDPNIFGAGTMDIVYDSGGRLATLDGAEKLRMMLVKCILTARYSESEEYYGSTVPRLLGMRSRGANELIDGMYAMAVDNALDSFRKAQPTNLDPSEKMKRRENEIQVTRDRGDRSILLVGVSVRNEEDTLVSIIHSFKTY